MKLRLALAAATCLALPIVAHAQPVVGPYVSLEGGTSILNPVPFNENLNFAGTVDANQGFQQNGKLQFRDSYAGIAGIGYGLGDGFRVELDGDYIHNTSHLADFDGGGDARTYGRENKYGPMVNLLYDISVGLPIYPYVGAGAGYQFVASKYSSGEGTTSDSFNPQTTFGNEKGSFAFDLIGGVAFPIDAVPGLSLTAEYRFMMLTETHKSNIEFLGGLPVGNPNPPGTFKFGQESSHTFTLGLRYALFPAPMMAPAPAPAPTESPAPVPAKTYLVFFDWDKYNLTPRATQIIAQAASDSHTSAVTTLDVSGYTDTSGTPTYNQGLSLRRAKAVAAQLVTDGVPAGEIAIHAFGETHLLVATGPGVREPQNRRVEIILQ